VGLMASVDRDLPIVTDAVDPKAAVSATTEPVLGADAVDDRAVNPRARERGERHAPFLEPCGRLDEAYRAVPDQVVEVDAPSQWSASDVPGHRLDQVQVSRDALVTRPGVRCLGVAGALHVLKSFVPSGCEWRLWPSGQSNRPAWNP